MKENVEKINDFEWKVGKETRKEMRVNAKIIANEKIFSSLEEEAIKQLTNVACLPGVLEPVVGLPDMHIGYGLPMGAVAAFSAENGVISSGMCGFDINCGVNSIRTNLSVDEVKPKLKELVETLFRNVPSGVGAKGKLKLNYEALDEVLINGVDWAIENGYGTKEDKKATEEQGRMDGADPSKVSDLAKKRGLAQLGTLGAGNHFLEVQVVDKVFDHGFAKKHGIEEKGQVMIMLHCGSRGLGHQVASDYLKIQGEAVKKYKIWIPDQQLVCAPIGSKEAEDYFSAMKCAVNYAFANRLVMTQWIRESFERVFKRSWEDMDMNTVYALCHNVIKKENHIVNGERKEVFVHRKGATRSFPGQPVLIAGTMGTASYILKGTDAAMEKTFGSSCHGSGRVMSRHEAIRRFRGERIRHELENQGKVVRATGGRIIAEEAPMAYKDVENVVDSVHHAGISLKVVRLKPLGVVKG